MGNPKGNRGENEVAKILQPWWQQLEPSAEFRKTPGSGGWRSSMNIRHDMKLAGDLMTNAEQFPFTIEVKRREGWSMEWLRKGRKSPVWEWWRQTQQDAIEEGGVPVLWFRQNHKKWRVMLPVDYVVENKLHEVMTPDMVWQHDQLLAVNVGDLFPVVFMATDMIELEPTRFAKKD